MSDERKTPAAIIRHGYSVIAADNGGWLVSASALEFHMRNYDAAFTDWADLVSWLKDAHLELVNLGKEG